MTKPSTTAACKVAIPVLLVSYGATVQADVSPGDLNSNSTDESSKPTQQIPPAATDGKARLVTVANANEQLDRYHYQGGTIDLNKVSFGQLQTIMDSFAMSGCAHAIQSACGWKVLKLERTGRGKDAEQLASVAAVLPAKHTERQTIDKPKPDHAPKVASLSAAPASEIKNEQAAATPVVHRPTVIASAVQQRVKAAEWAQSFSAPQPDEAAFIKAELVTPVTIDLPHPSEVKLVVNGHEKSREIMDAGHRLVNIDSLPDGSYPIEVHVTNDVEGQRTIQQTFRRRSLAVSKPTSSYGVLTEDTPDRRQSNSGVTREKDVVFRTTVLASIDADKGAATSVATEPASRSADATLERRGNRYRLTIDGDVSSQSALGHALKAAYLGKELTFSIQGVGFVPGREMTGDPTLANFLDTSEYRSLSEPGWHQGKLVFPLLPIRHQDPGNGLLETRAGFAARLALVVGKHQSDKLKMHFRFADTREPGPTQLIANLDNGHNESTYHSSDESTLEIETPFFNLG